VNRRIVITKSGGPDVLELIEEETPEPKPDEVLVKVTASGVAFGDVLKRTGLMYGMPKPPFTPGYDFAGTIEKIGESVSNFRAGEKVAAFIVNGGNADYVCVKEDLLVRVPEDVNLIEAAASVLNYVTAYQMLHRVAQIKPNERILIHGAAGGLGTAMLQLGKLANVEMYGTASANKHQLVKELGGVPIDYKKEDFERRIFELTDDGVDAVFDPVGGNNLRKSNRVLRSGGRLVAFGVSSAVTGGVSRAVQTLFLSFLYKILPNGKRSEFYGISGSKYSNMENVKEDLVKVFELLSQKKISPVIGAKLKLDEAVKAHEMMEHAAVTGKILLLSGE